MKTALPIAFVALAAGLATTGCSKKGAGGQGAFPPIQVIAIEAKRQPVSETLSLPGSITANEQVEVKAETDGIVQEINFAEGERVAKGRLLVVLDETKFAATLAEAEADLLSGGTAAEELEAPEGLQEAESELGINEWIDPDTGGPAEDNVPRIEDH